jgi:hypothetical protein
VFLSFRRLGVSYTAICSFLPSFLVVFLLDPAIQYCKMAATRYFSLLAMALAPSTSYAEHLYASHYDGTVNLLNFNASSRSLALTQSLKACGTMPAWLTWDATNRKLYCTDENYYSSTATLSSLSAGSDLQLSVSGVATTPSGGVANALYGPGYIAVAH